jgi:hypothetical protein
VTEPKDNTNAARIDRAKELLGLIDDAVDAAQNHDLITSNALRRRAKEVVRANIAELRDPANQQAHATRVTKGRSDKGPPQVGG